MAPFSHKGRITICASIDAHVPGALTLGVTLWWLPALIFELTFAAWLLTKGVKTPAVA